MTDAPSLIGSAEACGILGIDRSTLTRWVLADPPRINALQKMPGKSGAYIFDAAEVERVRKENEDAARPASEGVAS